MPELKIGVDLRCLRMPLKKALHAARRLGASAVQWDARGEVKPRDLSQTGLRQLKKLLGDLNLSVVAVDFHTRRGYNVADDLEARVAATKEAMTFARSLGAGIVINHVGRIPPESEGPDWQTLVEVLTDLGAYGNRVGATLAAETGAESETELARLLDALPAGAVGVNLDPGNLIGGGFSPTDAVEKLGSRILHVQVKDAVRDMAQGRGVEVPVGRGSVDFPAMLGALEEHGYRGYFTVERNGAEEPVVEIGQAIQFLRAL